MGGMRIVFDFDNGWGAIKYPKAFGFMDRPIDKTLQKYAHRGMVRMPVAGDA